MKPDFRKWPLTAEADHLFRSRYPFMAPTVARMAEEFRAGWCDAFEAFLGAMFKTREEWDHAFEGYVRFGLDAIRLHRRFEKELVYSPRSYAEASDLVYLNQDYMFNLYLPGIALSHYLWPHHYLQDEFFYRRFIEDMRLKDAGSFVEVGVGTGFYSRCVLTSLPGCSGTGYDISPYSLRYAERQASAFGCASRLRLENRNVIEDCPEAQATWLISVEVLEHLEDPLSFLKALRRMLRQGGKAFITAALNAPNEDHIYLYRDPKQVRDQIEEAGFHVIEYHFAQAYKPRAKGIPVPEIAAFIVG